MNAKRILIIALTCSFGIGIMHSQTKLDMRLNHLLTQQKVQRASAKTMGDAAVETQETQKWVTVMVQLQPGAEMPLKTLEEMGVKIGTRCGSFASMLVPIHQLEALSMLESIKAIEQGQRLNRYNRNSQIADHAIDVNNFVNADAAGLPRSFNGKGVIAAIPDEGIDFNHVNFRNSTTHDTRIKQAVVYRNYKCDFHGNITDLDGNVVQYSDIREVYTDPADIDSLTTDTDMQSHGTHTASTMAGSYRGSYLNINGKSNYSGLQGVAPAADLLLAGIGNTSEDFPILDALAQFKTKAEELGEPMVVSISFGVNTGWLDGKTIFPQFYDEYTDHGNKPGVIICQAAGNEGDANFTLYKELNADNDHTIRVDISSAAHPMINIYGSDATPFDVSIDCYKSVGWGEYEFVNNIPSDSLKSQGLLTCDTYENHDGRFAATLQTAINKRLLSNSSYIPVLVIKSEEDCKIRLIALTYDSSYETYIPQHLGKAGGISGLTSCNPNSSFNTEACTNSVISVGAWTANSEYTSYSGRKSDIGLEVGNVAYFSSFVDEDDYGISRPDVLSPGVCVISGYNSYDITSWNDGYSYGVCGKAKDEYLEGHTSIIGQMSGTSMACPNAAGIVALWLQANPELTVNQIREVIQATSTKDSYTNAAPTQSGAGKINALEGVKYILNNLPSSIHNVDDNFDSRMNETTRKCIVDGKLMIVRGGKQYNIAGIEL